ncbi:glycosyl hydrolase [uncultured Peptoniphilus sp.]|uniref:WD40/YVTN/BNR-like repeat-containing protein n=1 Tax=uncultured Peptoniphilus sp. TaxID=254354 RepID=UPI002806507F|nr:glycosyl hydrolase [uncultured Peptoniphilus sp.]
MKNLVDYIFIFLYSVLMFFLWKICKYGSWRYWINWIIPILFLILVCIIYKILNRNIESSRKSRRIKLYMFIIVTLIFGGMIIHTAIPYNGKLSWKVDEMLNHKRVRFVHRNIFDDGIEGLIEDLEKKFTLPDKLFVDNELIIRFDRDGEITKLEGIIYGKDEKGKVNSYLLSFKNKKLEVWLSKDHDLEIDESRALDPMIKLLKKSKYQKEIDTWKNIYGDVDFGIIYYGWKEFFYSDVIKVLGSKKENDEVFKTLEQGGEVKANALSIFIPDKEVTPINFIIDPEIISSETRNAQLEEEVIEMSKDEDTWTLDNNTGTMYTFLKSNKNIGFRLVVTDAALGSRFYKLEKTSDGGKTWENINYNPFLDGTGVAEGIEFLNVNFGFAGLQGGSGEHSEIYVTRDGGANFEKINLPYEKVQNLPEKGKEYGLTIENYKYLKMPRMVGNKIYILATPDSFEEEGIEFYSEDECKTWQIFK